MSLQRYQGQPPRRRLQTSNTSAAPSYFKFLASVWGKHSMTEFVILSLTEVTGTEPLGDRFPPRLGQATEPHAEWWGNRPWAVLGGAAWLWAAIPPAHELSFPLPAGRQRPSRMSHKTAISQPCRALPHL